METNLDDGTAEHLAFCVDLLLQQGGAADAWVTPIVMKKGRAAHTLHCLCHFVDKDRLLEIMFRHSTTLGVRVQTIERVALPRRILRVGYTNHHSATLVKVKVGYLGKDEVVSIKPEYDDCKQISLATGETLQRISERVVRLAQEQLAQEKSEPQPLVSEEKT